MDVSFDKGELMHTLNDKSTRDRVLFLLSSVVTKNSPILSELGFSPRLIPGPQLWSARKQNNISTVRIVPANFSSIGASWKT